MVFWFSLNASFSNFSIVGLVMVNFLASVCLGNFFLPHFWKTALFSKVFLVNSWFKVVVLFLFFSSALWIFISTLLVWNIFFQRNPLTCILWSLCLWCVSYFCCSQIFFSSLIFGSLIIMCVSQLLFELHWTGDLCTSCTCMLMSFFTLGKFTAIIYLNILAIFSFFSFFNRLFTGLIS